MLPQCSPRGWLLIEHGRTGTCGPSGRESMKAAATAEAGRKSARLAGHEPEVIEITLRRSAQMARIGRSPASITRSAS
ncbi:hypothetical protein LSAT2_017746 [Lamellibrachia satsuma]|nr:hypothetical protein LSAT2_017746 [Lamellibrachia satsuma]